MTEIIQRLADTQNGFVQGEITEFTGNHENALMETDVTRISDQINSELIDPVIDFIIACDDVLADSVDKTTRLAESAERMANDADVKAVQATIKADAANSLAGTANSEAARAHTRLNDLKIPNLDTQTWKWMTKSLDSVEVVKKPGVALAVATQKPFIVWSPVRTNFDDSRYFLEGRFQARISLMLHDWYINSGGYRITIGDIGVYGGTISLRGLSNDRMEPNNIQINAYTQTNKQHVISASATAIQSNSQDVKLTIMVNSKGEDFNDSRTPVIVDLVMMFRRDSGNFGSGNLFPELRPN